MCCPYRACNKAPRGQNNTRGDGGTPTGGAHIISCANSTVKPLEGSPVSLTGSTLVLFYPYRLLVILCMIWLFSGEKIPRGWHPVNGLYNVGCFLIIQRVQHSPILLRIESSFSSSRHCLLLIPSSCLRVAMAAALSIHRSVTVNGIYGNPAEGARPLTDQGGE